MTYIASALMIVSFWFMIVRTDFYSKLYGQLLFLISCITVLINLDLEVNTLENILLFLVTMMLTYNIVSIAYYWKTLSFSKED
jgi:hypothetical protein